MKDVALRQRLVGADALAFALARTDAVRLVLVRDGPLSTPAREAVAEAERRGIATRRVRPRELLRLVEGRDVPEVLALVGPDPESSLPELVQRGGAIWLLVRPAYPTNAGAVIRTAEVTGASGVVIDADFDHDRRRDAFRIAMRADRLLPVLFEVSDRCLAAAAAAGVRCVAVEDSGRVAPWECDLRGPVLLLVGSEQEGIPEPVLRRCDEVIRLPMPGFIPSYGLQAAMAAVASERLRQCQGDENLS